MYRFFTTLILGFCLLGGLFSLSAKSVDPTQAEQIATNFYTANAGHAPSNMRLSMTAQASISNQSTRATNSDSYYFLFEAGTNEGFVLVAGDDRVTPILAYGLSGTFELEFNDMPYAMQKWFMGIQSEIHAIISNDLPASREMIQEWEALIDGSWTMPSTRTSVAPLISQHWAQSAPYNDLCPSNNSGRAITGCVATGMAMVMKYHDYPAHGTGTHGYTENDYGYLSKNFGSIYYDWNNMPDNLHTNSPAVQKNAVATLMSSCGVAVDMNYGVNGSGANPFKIGPALIDYFGYDGTSVTTVRQSNYSNPTDWTNLVKAEFDNQRPIIMFGFGPNPNDPSKSAGHCFVGDGYDTGGRFHINWGWGGYQDGYFAYSQLNPGSYIFSQRVGAIIGIKPSSGLGTSVASNFPPSATTLVLDSDLTVSSGTIGVGGSFTVSTTIVNGLASDPAFSGDIAILLKDQYDHVFDTLGPVSVSALAGGAILGGGLSFTKTLEVPGEYRMVAYARYTGSDWTIIEKGAYTNEEYVDVEAQVSDIRILSDFVTTPAVPEIDDPFDVKLKVVNFGSTPFVGDFSVDVIRLNGSYIGELARINYTNGLATGEELDVEFTGLHLDSLGISEAGSYLLIMYERRTGGTWEIVRKLGNFTNPVAVSFSAPSLPADSYEDNNRLTDAFEIPLNFVNDSATFKTGDASIHFETDNDIYKVELPEDSSYTFFARVHDLENSGDGMTYTKDAMFSYTMDGENYSIMFDDVMLDSVTVNGPATLYFQVTPHFVGFTGTYAFELGMTQGALMTNSIGDFTIPRAKVFPNPAQDQLSVEIPAGTGWMQSVILIDQTGRTVWQPGLLPSLQTQFTLSGWDLPTGVYMLQMRTERAQWQETIVIE